MLSKNVNNKKCAPEFVFFNEKKIRNIRMIFLHRKLSLKVRFWHFLTPPHYINLQNSMISFDYSWFLAKILFPFLENSTTGIAIFLGMSVFGIISLFSQLIHEEKPKKVLNLAKQTSVIVRESMIVRDNVKQTQEEMGKVQKIILANNTKLKSTANNNKKTNLESTNL